MGLRLVPRTIEAIQAAGRLAKYRVIDKPRLDREAAEQEEHRQREEAQRDEAERRRREEEIVYEKRRAYAREKGERQAIIEMHEEAWLSAFIFRIDKKNGRNGGVYPSVYFVNLSRHVV